jgi:hypothetical protein
MACPFFIPTVRLDGAWKFPDRLPLPPGFSGVCGAPEQMLVRPSDDDLRDHCNLGHAACSRLPEQRHADSIRFSARGAFNTCMRKIAGLRAGASWNTTSASADGAPTSPMRSCSARQNVFWNRGAHAIVRWQQQPHIPETLAPLPSS